MCPSSLSPGVGREGSLCTLKSSPGQLPLRLLGAPSSCDLGASQLCWLLRDKVNGAYDVHADLQPRPSQEDFLVHI